ncbi:TonB-dependent receptor domain-containing protein [Mucilaginibacter sp. AW1-3]
MKYILSVLFILLFSINRSSAQAPATPKMEIKGMVTDSATSKPMPFVTVILKAPGSNVPIKSSLTKDNGSFDITNVTAGKYQLAVTSLGYKAKLINLTDAVDGVVDVKNVLLSPSTGQLKEVSIVEAKPLIKQEVDRIGYDVQADPESKAQSVLDMMRKVPLLSVDANDNIKLKGTGNYKILINGKESALMAKNPSDVLKSMPATNIEKIEVITTPPAKYDAEGLAGIINIITKKNADQGYNGSINTRFNSVFGPGINLNGTVKQGKFGLSGYIGYGSNGSNDNSNGNTQNFTGTPVSIEQYADSHATGNNHYGNAEMSYEIDTLNLVTASYQFYGGDFDQTNNQYSNTFNGSQITEQYNLNNDGNYNYKGSDAAINYQLGFKRNKDQLLTLSYKYSYSPNTQLNTNVVHDVVGQSGLSNYQQYNDAGNKEHTVQLDYVQPINKKLNFEAGGKTILRNNYSDYRTSAQNPITDAYDYKTQAHSFNYHQDVYSFYNSYQLKLEKWTAKAGVRVEHTQINSDSTAGASAIDRAYTNVIPSVSVQRSFKSSSVTLGFTQRIQRPGIYQLNPFVDATNPKFITTGNPNLQPELNNTFQLTYSNFKKNALTAGLSYAFSNNSIQNVSYASTRTVGGVTDTITTTTFQNLGTNKTLGLNINYNLSTIKRFSLSINAQVQHVWLKGTYGGSLYSNDGYGGNAFINMGYKFDKGYRLGFNGGYFIGDVNLQGRNGNYLYNSYVAGIDVLKKKGTISLVANNPYSKYFTSHSTTNTATYYQDSYYSYRYASFAVRLNYRFGKLNSNIKQNQRGINNDDTKSGGGSKSNSN